MDRHLVRRRVAMAATTAALAICGHAGRVLGASSPLQSSAIGDVFTIDLENHNWTQPDGNVAAAPSNGVVQNGTTSFGGIQQLYGNPAAPYINSLVTPGNPNAAQVSYSSNYHNALATPSGNNPSIHPSELNYIWQEAGSNDGVTNDNDPFYPTGPGNAAVVQNFLSANPSTSPQNLTGLMQSAGLSWKSYDEDSNLLTATGDNADVSNGTVTSAYAAPGSTTVPISSLSGTSASYTNPYNGSHQYNYAAKHVGSLYFTDTNGGYDTTTANVEASHYAPLQQLQTDLNANMVSRYNVIIPDQYNDAHTGLSGGFIYNGVHYYNDAAQIAQADNFLSIVIPEIEASAAYQNNGAIVIWTDETELDSTGGSQNDYGHTLSDIVISPLAKGNAYRSTLDYTHSSDLATMQEIFGLTATPAGVLNDAGNADTNDLSDLFLPGAIPDASSTSSRYIYVGTGGTSSAPVTGNWSANTSWLNGAAPATSTNKELDFLDSTSNGFTATNDNPGKFSLNILVLGNNTGNTDTIASAPGDSLSFAGTAACITQSGSGPFSITTSFAIASTPLTINGTGTGPLNISGAISGTGFGLAFSALNVTTLSGSNSYTGATAINSGTVVLDYTSQNKSKLSSTSGLTIGSAVLQINGNTTGALTQTVAGLQVNGAGTINISSGQTSLALGAISVSVGGSVNFINNGSITTITTSTSVELGNNFGTGILGAYAVYNGITWATLASSSYSSIVGFTAFGSTNGSTGTIDPIRESLDITSSNSNFTADLETMRYNTASPVITTIGSAAVDFTGTYGGILMTANVGANNNLVQGSSIESGGDFYVHQYDTLGFLTISSQFTEAGNSAYNLIKDGPGILYLSYNGAESYNGNVYLGGGLVSTQYTGDLQNTLIFNGGGIQPTNGITLTNNAIINAAGGVVDVLPGSTSLLSGAYSGVGGLTKTSAGAVILSGSNTYAGGTTISGGSLTFGSLGAFPFNTALTINNDSKAIVSNTVVGARNSLIVTTLTIASRGKLDLNNNDLIVESSTLSAVSALVAQSYTNGTWSGYGITSTAAANNSAHLTALGVIENSVDGTTSGAILYPAFDSDQDSGDTDVLVKYTYYGDANLDGKVDGSDYTRIDSGFLNHRTGWFNGDFNYDGVVNGSDYTLIDNAFNTQGASFAAEGANPQARLTSEIAVSTSVPEPGSLNLLSLILAGLMGQCLIRQKRGVCRQAMGDSKC